MSKQIEGPRAGPLRTPPAPVRPGAPGPAGGGAARRPGECVELHGRVSRGGGALLGQHCAGKIFFTHGGS